MATLSQASRESNTSAQTDLSCNTADVDSVTGYIRNIDQIRRSEYPALNGTTYLDHAGTTLYPRSLIEAYAADLTANLYGNPHSASASSQLSTRRVDDVRVQILKFFKADPEQFELIFTANATAAIKLVAEAFRDHGSGFSYAYHVDAHTSLVGVRELAKQGSQCLQSSEDVQQHLKWLAEPSQAHPNIHLLAYPGQSNMTGERYSLDWCAKTHDLRERLGKPVYTLYDAASLLSTAPLDLSNPERAPDFTALSFYKIFGFPDLGALIVRKVSGEVLRNRKYFAGGTVESVSITGDLWHAKKETLYSLLEDGTLPFHNIIALSHACKIHTRIYHNMDTISRHTKFLHEHLYTSLSKMQHFNGNPVFKLYSIKPSPSNNTGPIIAFNILDAAGKYVSNSEVEKLGVVKSIQFRTGGLCNPGGIARHLELSTDELKQNYAAGQRCGGGNDVMNGKPTGTIRVSLGAMSNITDIETFISFLDEFYVTKTISNNHHANLSNQVTPFIVEGLSVFPIKSCSAFQIPPDLDWEVVSKGLAWDREWCLVHQGTNKALSQKQYPRMTLLQPSIDLKQRLLHIAYPSHGDWKSITIDLNHVPKAQTTAQTCNTTKNQSSIVCGETIPIHLYTSSEVSDFFSTALGVPCTLARYAQDQKARHANIRAPKQRSNTTSIQHQRRSQRQSPTIKLSNESPILLISRSSVNRLNEQIKQNHHSSKFTPKIPQTPRTIPASTFRGNILISQNHPTNETPYIEDTFTSIQITNNSTGTTSTFESLGPCQRCQMVCVDQKDGTRSSEPFSTLAKTRRGAEGGVWFGVHLCLVSDKPSREDDDDDDGGGDGDGDGGDSDNGGSGSGAGNDDTDQRREEKTQKKKKKVFIRVGDSVTPVFGS